MSDAVAQEELFDCFQDPVSSGTNEEGALRLLSGFPYPEQVREMRDRWHTYAFYIDDNLAMYGDDRDSSLLHYACRNGWYDVSRKLVEQYNCDVHLKNGSSYTPLHFACMATHIFGDANRTVDIVRFLVVDQHCDPTCRGRLGETPLHCACDSGALDIVRFLVEECCCDPILHFVCKTGKLDIVTYFVEKHHCDPLVKNDDGDTALHCACQVNGNTDIVRFLVVDQHCDPTCRGRWGRTPLHYACDSGALDIVRFLVEERHCDPGVRSTSPDDTPLHLVCKTGKLDIVTYLVEKCRCDPGVKNKSGDTPLHYACQNNGNIDIVRFLVDQHCNAKCHGWNGRTPLHNACNSGALDIVRFLVEECECDPGVRDTISGDTPLHLVCKEGKLDIITYLVEKCRCDPGVKNNDDETPLHYACQKNGNIDIVRFLVDLQHCNPACCGEKGRTPLHYACGSEDLDMVMFLVDECQCDPFGMKDAIGDTPLHWATYKNLSNDVVKFLLSSGIPPLKVVKSVLKFHSIYPHVQILEVLKRCRTEYPLESAFKVFVLGNHAAGKSTLVKIIENQITSLFGSFAGQWRNISKKAVEPLTAGIVPVSVESRRLGQIVIYDMAGHYQYYSSHAAMLRNLVSSSASMFLVVVSLNQSKEDIVRQLQYWNSFIANCCTSAGKPPKVAVFSHADEVTEEKPERKSSDAVKALTHSEASSSFSEVVTLDCRKLASGGLTRISQIVDECCSKVRQTFRVDFAVHLLYAFISSKLAGKIICTVSELQSLIKKEQGKDSFALKLTNHSFLYDSEFLPTNTSELSQHLTTLSDKGQFLFLRNAGKVEDSWVVINKAVLLSEVNGTIFAPDNFKQHHDIANSTGVVPFSKVREVFPKRDPDLVVAFLQHLEFCQEISESEVSLITTRHFRCSCGPMERFFFFPALVSEERPGEASAAIETPSYRCGWILQCSQPHQFLTPQFLHVLLLRLAFSFALAPDNMHEVQPSPVLERRCCVWKNGICWLSRDGVQTTVEETKQHSAYTVTMECLKGQEMECTGHRSQVLKCILNAKDELCATIEVRESLIDLTVREVGIQHMFSLAELAEALAEKKAVVVSQPGRKVARIDDLLYFEPYACVRPEGLFSEENSNQVISEAFLEEVSETCYTKVDQLKHVLSINGAKLRDALGRVPPFQRDPPEYQCKQVFQVWKESTQTPTYGALRSALDKYSVFCGRNPLELAGCLPETTVAVVPSEQPPPVSPPTHHSPPAGDTHRGGQPTLIELVRFRGRERRINVPQEVSTKYTQFGILLLEDNYGHRVHNMEHKHSKDPEQINMEILEEWVSGRGKQPVSWGTLTDVLRDVELCVLASEIEAVKLPSDSDFDLSGRGKQPVSMETHTEVIQDMELDVTVSETEAAKPPSDSFFKIDFSGIKISMGAYSEDAQDMELGVPASNFEAVKLPCDSDFDLPWRDEQPISVETFKEILRNIGELGGLTSEIEAEKPPSDLEPSDSDVSDSYYHLSPYDYESSDSELSNSELSSSNA